MYYNLKNIETIISGMKCEFATQIWNDFLRKEYALQTKDCVVKKKEELEYFLPIIEHKQKLLNNFKKNKYYYDYPSMLCETDLDSFWNADCVLKDCTDQILNKFKHYAKSVSVLNLSGDYCNTCK